MISDWTPQHTRLLGTTVVAQVTMFVVPTPQVRLRRALDTLGWGPREGEIRFERNHAAGGWFLGNGTVVTPWTNRVNPTDPAQALADIEQHAGLVPWTGIWWETETGQGPVKSILAGHAMADRQLRLEQKLPYLGTRQVRVPSCGHISCMDLMGCQVEASIVNRWPSMGDPVYATPGQTLTMHQVGNIGRWSHDWIVGSPT